MSCISMPDMNQIAPYGSTRLLPAGPRKLRRRYICNKRDWKNIPLFARHYLAASKPDPELWSEIAEQYAASRQAVRGDRDQVRPLDRSGYRAKQRAVLGLNDDASLNALSGAGAALWSRKLILQAGMIRWPDWTLPVSISGTAHLDGAVGSGRPVIIWADNTIMAELAGRAGVAQAGIRAMHHSDWVHEHGTSHASTLMLQRHIFRLEQRFMDERILSTPTTHFSSMRKFAQALRENRAILSMNNAFLGRRHACTPIDGEWHLVQAVAPLNMARCHGASIVPMTAIELEPFKRYRIKFHPPIEADPQLDRDEDIRRMAHQSANRMLSTIREHPSQWMCWVGDQISQLQGPLLARKGM